MRYALRTLVKSPGFAIIAILSVAFGVGLNATMFSYVDAVLLRPLPAPDAGRVVEVASTSPETRVGQMSYPDYADLRDQTRTLSALTCYNLTPMGLSASREGAAQMTLGVIASGNFFSGLGIAIPLGRAFRPDEDVASGARPGRGDQPFAVAADVRLRSERRRAQAAHQRRGVHRGRRRAAEFSGPEAFVLPDVYVP